ncbi:hypothetical protein K402DRAFT_453143 [Aulographum hederae CBS 113979]|uniref:Sister chromatid cohesion and DNA repair protein n=1 Tax=Aulographum hederae CBS 113979 TaxID=1176131 RepID=A0A6G1H4K8_9PEZI|nr:hypothetical protein K402DRAFT_453143 [Aulographum hederae CBS 113979]
MPGTRRRAQAPVEVEEEEGDMQEDGEEELQLQFNEPLTWRAGKPIPVAELLRRLQALAEELKSLDQEDVERESLIHVAKELATTNLLSHKDRGVRAWTACCVVDMFKLCAPDAPYTAAQLKDIFNLIISTVFPSLADPSSPYNAQHLYVLKSLSDVKSIILLTDLPSANSLTLQLFTACFDVLSGPSKAESGEELSKNVEHQMTAILSQLVDEAQVLSAEAVDVILAQFLRADPRTMVNGSSKGKKRDQVDTKQSTLLLKEAPPAYNMAKNICNSCPDKMARLISQYFSSVIVDASTAGMTNGSKHKPNKKSAATVDSDDDGPAGPSDEDLEETKKAHRLLRELWRSAPSVLQEIIPQLEAELGAEDVNLRLLATETLGDMVSGIGAAGPPPVAILDPAAYPSQSLSDAQPSVSVYNFLTTPSSPHSFPSRHSHTYQSFVSRRNDKSPIIRSAWTTGVGRIIMTSAGGVGLETDDENQLIKSLSDMLIDGDERVRLSAVKAVERFDFHVIVQKLGSMGGINDAGSLLCNLADRVKDRKPNVRTEAMKLLGRVWGVAAGAIAEGSERISTLLGPIPSKILDTHYVNDLEISALADHVLFESLLPISYPPLKPKASPSNGTSQGAKAPQVDVDQARSEADIDRIRTERILVLIRDLEPKAKKVLFAHQARQPTHAKLISAILSKCEEYNGGVVDKKNEKEVKDHLGKFIDHLSKTLPDSQRVSEDLWKFATTHDRRNYSLIRFAMAPESDYRKVYKAIKELTKRLEEAPGSSSTMLNTLMVIIYRSGVLLYNRSHVPAILDSSRSDEKGLSSTAHDILREISSHIPEVFKVHLKELCRSLEADAPSAKKPNGPGAVEDLKACAGFAQRFPNEIPKSQKFLDSLMKFSQYGSPPKAAKYAVSILLTSSGKKELYAKDILTNCTQNFEHGKGHYLTQLASLSQLVLLSHDDIEEDSDAILDIAIQKVLLNDDATAEPVMDDAGKEVEWTSEPDEVCLSKMWALKILTNRLRSYKDNDPDLGEACAQVYKLLHSILAFGGELTKTSTSPKAHQSQMRLLAAQLLLKLCRQPRFDKFLPLKEFNRISTVAQDSLVEVRSGFINTLMKYLGQDKLPRRFFAMIFLLAFEPDSSIKKNAETWIRARSAAFARAKDTAMESSFARLISLLAHHPDFGTSVEELTDFVQYILFYLKCVANEQNIALIYHVAQRIKSVSDGIDPAASENLYVLSDLSQAIIRRLEELNGWSMQAWPAKLKMPAQIFRPLSGHEEAQEIANKQYAPEELIDGLDDIVKVSLRTKKRKADTGGEHRSKKRIKSSTAAPKTKALPIRKPAKTPKPKKTRISDLTAPSSDVRRSNRGAKRKSYFESSDEENEENENDDIEMGDAEEEEEEVDDVDDGAEAAADDAAGDAAGEAAGEAAEEAADQAVDEAADVEQAEAAAEDERSSTVPAGSSAKSSPKVAKKAKTNGSSVSKAKGKNKKSSPAPRKGTRASARTRSTRSGKADAVVEVSSAGEESEASSMEA